MTEPALRQYTCVAIGGRAVLFDGPPGSGKSTLALSLIDRGAMLVGDDGVSLSARDGALWASPPPNTGGLIEVRNVGLCDMRTCEAPVALLLRLISPAPRYVEQADRAVIVGCEIPALDFDPAIPAATVRAELALARHAI